MNREKSTIRELLINKQPVSTFTSGVSMEPLLYDGRTHVILLPVSGELQVGELPLFQTPDGRYVIHRIIAADNEYYYTRGDNCIETETVPKEWVLGYVTEIYRKGKYIRVTDRSYHWYVSIWMKSFPVRRLWYLGRYRYRNFLKKLKKTEE